MATAWTVLTISAITDFVISWGGAIMAAMVATGSAEMPSRAVMLLAVITGLVAAARTVQQALKATPQMLQNSKGGSHAETSTTPIS